MNFRKCHKSNQLYYGGGDKEDIALDDASIEGNLSLVKSLIEKGADIHFNNDSPLLNAVSKGYLDIVRYLVESHGIDLKHYEGKKGVDGIMTKAIQSENVDLVKFLLEKGVSMTSKGFDDVLFSENKKMTEIMMRNGVKMDSDLQYEFYSSDISPEMITFVEELQQKIAVHNGGRRYNKKSKTKSKKKPRKMNIDRYLYYRNAFCGY